MGRKHKITEWDVQALFDNELSPEEEAVVLEALAEDPALQNHYNLLKRQCQLLQLWWKDH